jgi:hypothetical protein
MGDKANPHELNLCCTPETEIVTDPEVSLFARINEDVEG